MAAWLSNTLGNIAISWAAWAQNRYFEPEHYHAPWVTYSHDGVIDQCEHPPEPLPGVAVWRRISDTDQYERVDVPPPNQEPATPLTMPIIQAVVRFHTHGRRQRRSRAKPRDFDITADLQRFQGYPALDWLHVGMCVQHAHGVTVLPGQYTLSIIDGSLELHELSEEEAAVFSVCPSTASPDPFGLGLGLGFDQFDAEPVSEVPQLPLTTDVPEPTEGDPEPDEQHEVQEEGEDEDPEPDFDDWEVPDDGDDDSDGVVRVQDSDDDDSDAGGDP